MDFLADPKGCLGQAGRPKQHWQVGFTIYEVRFTIEQQKKWLRSSGFSIVNPKSSLVFSHPPGLERQKHRRSDWQLRTGHLPPARSSLARSLNLVSSSLSTLNSLNSQLSNAGSPLHAAKPRCERLSAIVPTGISYVFSLFSRL